MASEQFEPIPDSAIVKAPVINENFYKAQAGVLPTESNTFHDIHLSFAGAPTDGQRVAAFVAPRDVNFQVDAIGSRAFCFTAPPENDWTFDVHFDGVSVGSVTFVAGSRFGGFSLNDGITQLPSLDFLEIFSPNPIPVPQAVGATPLADLFFALMGFTGDAPSEYTPPEVEGAVYVSTTGNDSNNGEEISPVATIAKALSISSRVLIEPGTYTDSLQNIFPSGTQYEPTVIAAKDPNNPPILAPSSGSISCVISDRRWIEMHDLIIDCAAATLEGMKISQNSSSCRDLKFNRIEVKNAVRNGILVARATDIEFTGCDIHHNGTASAGHGLYVSGSRVLVDGCHVHDNARWGIHVYDETQSYCNDNTVRNNVCANNGQAGNKGSGIILASGSGHVAYNNVCYGNYYGLTVQYGADGAKVIGNTIVNNGVGGGLLIGDNNVEVKNNIVWGNPYVDSGTGTINSNNLVGVDPLFANEAGDDYHLTASSPAVDNGVDTGITGTDIEGNARNQGAAVDIGAYEYA